VAVAVGVCFAVVAHEGQGSQACRSKAESAANSEIAVKVALWRISVVYAWMSCYILKQAHPTELKAHLSRFVLQAPAPALTIARRAWIINSTMNLTSRKVCAGWWRWHVDAPACAPAL
jgi:hypothetical protein